jgi:hypothetical protein
MKTTRHASGEQFHHSKKIEVVKQIVYTVEKQKDAQGTLLTQYLETS